MNKFSISLCITTYNRTGLLYESFQNVIDHALIGEIVIVDDASEEHIRTELFNKFFGVPKISLHFNLQNLGCYRNKKEAVSKASNEWVILWDSDNILTKAYLDRLENLLIAGVNAKTLYQPDFAKPNFNFEAYQGLIITKHNVARYADQATFTTMLNAMNYFVNRDEYIRTWEDRPEPWTADSLLQNYNWLNAGNQIYVVPSLQYDHRVHEGSHYKEHVHKTGNLYNELVHKLKLMA